MKTCPSCGEVRNASEFYRAVTTKDGLFWCCKSCARERHRDYRRRNPEKAKAASNAQRHRNPEKTRAAYRSYNRALRDEFLAEYGGACVCCGTTEREFLTLEHKLGGGGRHRREVGGSNTNMLRDLKKKGWPKDAYTILCRNCNWASRQGRECPHARDRRMALKLIVVG